MNLNLTSLEEAWGVNHQEMSYAENKYKTNQSEYLQKYVRPINESSQIRNEFHPNSITQSVPTLSLIHI